MIEASISKKTGRLTYGMVGGGPGPLSGLYTEQQFEWEGVRVLFPGVFRKIMKNPWKRGEC